MTKISQVSIDISNVTEPNDVINPVLSLCLKLEKVVEAFQHTEQKPDLSYKFVYSYQNQSSEFIVSSKALREENDLLTKRLLALNVPELLTVEDPRVSFKSGAYQHIVDVTLFNKKVVVSGSELQFYDKKQRRTPSNMFDFKDLPADLQITVERVPLGDAEIAELRQRQVKEAIETLKKAGFTLNDGVITL